MGRKRLYDSRVDYLKETTMVFSLRLQNSTDADIIERLTDGLAETETRLGATKGLIRLGMLKESELGRAGAEKILAENELARKSELKEKRAKAKAEAEAELKKRAEAERAERAENELTTELKSELKKSELNIIELEEKLNELKKILQNG